MTSLKPLGRLVSFVDSHDVLYILTESGRQWHRFSRCQQMTDSCPPRCIPSSRPSMRSHCTRGVILVSHLCVTGCIGTHPTSGYPSPSSMNRCPEVVTNPVEAGEAGTVVVAPAVDVAIVVEAADVVVGKLEEGTHCE